MLFGVKLARGVDVTAMAAGEGTLLGEAGDVAVGLLSEATDEMEEEGAAACSSGTEAEPLSTVVLPSKTAPLLCR